MPQRDFGVFEKRARVADFGRVGQLGAANVHHGPAHVARRGRGLDAQVGQRVLDGAVLHVGRALGLGAV